MNKGIESIIDYYLGLLLKFRWLIILPFFLAMISGIALGIVLPKTYEAKTLILVESERVRPGIGEPVVEFDFESRVNTIREQIFSRTNIENIINTFQLLSGPEHKEMFLEDKVRDVRKHISIQLTGSNRQRAFSVSYRDNDPEKAMKVADTLTNTFIDRIRTLMLEKATNTTQFLGNQLTDIRKKLAEVENELKDYRRQYMGGLPEQLDANLRALDRIQARHSDRAESLRDAKNRLAKLESDSEGRLAQLRTQIEARQQNIAALIPQTGAGNTIISEPAQRLAQLRTDLSNLLSKYTEIHPDVIRLKKKIKECEKELTNQPEIVAGQNESEAGHSEAESMPPEFVLAKGQIIQETESARQEIQREIRDIEQEILILKTESSEYQNKVDETPKREQELISLQRDYRNIQSSYNSLLDRYLQAEMAESMQRDQSDQFRVVDPAKIPQRPVSPNMLILFAGFTVGGLGVGTGILILIDFFDPSFKNISEIESTLGVTVLGTVSRVLNKQEKIKRKFNQIFSLLSILINMALFAIFALLTIKGPAIAEKFIKGFS